MFGMVTALVVQEAAASRSSTGSPVAAAASCRLDGLRLRDPAARLNIVRGVPAN